MFSFGRNWPCMLLTFCLCLVSLLLLGAACLHAERFLWASNIIRCKFYFHWIHDLRLCLCMYIEVIMNISDLRIVKEMQMMTWFSPVLGQHPSPSTTKDDQIKKMVFSSQCICLNSVLFYDKKQLLFSRAEAVIARAYEWVPQEVPRWKENKRERRKKGNKPEKWKKGNRPERRSVNSRLELFFF